MTVVDAEPLLRWLYEHPKAMIAVDTETTGLRVADKRDICIGVSITVKRSVGYLSTYVAYNHKVGQNADDKTRSMLKYVLRQGRRLVFANCQFDFLFLETVGVKVDDMPFYDIQTMANTARFWWPMSKSLDMLAQAWLGKDDKGKMHEWAYVIYDEVPKRIKNDDGKYETVMVQKPRIETTLDWQKKNGWPHTTPEMIAEYACDDTETTLAVCEKILEHPGWREQPDDFWPNKEKLIRVLTEMKRRGIRVDTELAAQLEAEGVAAKETLLEQLNGLNPSSVKDAPKIFLDLLGLPVLKETPKGAPSFTKAVLEEYDHILENREDKRPEVGYVKAWRGWTTAIGLLLRPYQELVSPDGRLRTSYTTHVTATGRLSSREPNLQQISKEGGSPWNDRVKKCFIPKPGYVLLSADYSQLELRLAVAYAQEPELQQIFEEGRDIFTEMAQEMGWPRSKTKSFVYATQYGGGDARISYIFNVSIAEAKKLREKFYRKYPRFRKLDMACRKQAGDTKKLKLWSGRVKHFQRSEDSYKAMNALLQGGAADIVERVWIYVMENLDNEDCRCLLQVHDALVFEVREDLADEYARKIEAVMSDVNGICAPGSAEPLFPVRFAVDVTPWE